MAELSPTQITPPRAVLFDWDNTLASTWGVIHAAMNETLAAMGQAPWTFEESQARIRASLRDSFPGLFGDRWEEARDIYYAHIAAHHLEHLRPLPGAATLLERCHAAGLYLAVLSNKTGRFLRAEADALGWTGRFGTLVGAGDAPADKPDPAAALLALGPSGMAPGPDVWLVGDTDIDMQAAHAAGCLPVLIGDTPHHEAGLERYPPALRFADCQSLSTFLERLRDTISLSATSGHQQVGSVSL